MMEQALVEMTNLELRVDEYFQRDDLSIPQYAGPHLVVVAFGGRLAALTAQGRSVTALPFATGTALLEAAALARTEDVEPGADTATGRTYTQLHLDVRHARGPSHSFSVTGTINHCEPHALPVAWSRLLRLLCDAMGATSRADAEAWELALTWSSPVDLGPVWTAGGAVRLPHRVTAFEHDGPVFLRVGQRPGPSSLYRLEDVTLTCVDDSRRVEPVERQGRRWMLPEGGSVTLHQEWNRPPRIVVRVDDQPRGLFVQRG